LYASSVRDFYGRCRPSIFRRREETTLALVSRWLPFRPMFSWHFVLWRCAANAALELIALRRENSARGVSGAATLLVSINALERFDVPFVGQEKNKKKNRVYLLAQPPLAIDQKSRLASGSAQARGQAAILGLNGNSVCFGGAARACEPNRCSVAFSSTACGMVRRPSPVLAGWAAGNSRRLGDAPHRPFADCLRRKRNSDGNRRPCLFFEREQSDTI